MLSVRIVLSMVFAILTLWFGLSVEPEQAAHFVRQYGYHFTALSGLGFVFYLGCWVLSSPRRSGRLKFKAQGWLIAALVIATGTGVVFTGAHLDYKILMDDYLLAATAKSLHQTGEVAVADFGREVAGDFVVFQSFVDKRPWFYPFLVSLLHDAFGYDPVHSFAVNACCAVVLLGVAYALGYAFGGSGAATLSVLLWASLPLLQQNASGGGMEMLNLLMLHLLVLLSIYYLRAPNSKGEGALCLAGVLLTYTRYESGIFLGAVLLVILLGWYRERRVFLSWAAVFAAPLLLAVLLQTRIYAATSASWELATGVVSPFALSHLWNNIPHAFAFFWSRDPAIANSWLLGVLAIPVVLGFACLCVRERGNEWWRKPANQVWALFAAFLMLNLIVVLSFHASQFDQRYVARYSLPAHGLIVFSAVAVLAYFRSVRWLWCGAIGLTAIFIVVCTLPKNSQALYTKANFMIAEQHWLEALDTEHVKAGALVVDRFNSTWTLRERAALPPHVVLAHQQRIKAELASGKYSQILLVERVIESAGQPQPPVPEILGLKQVFEAELIEAESFRAGHVTRVYRLRP